MPDDTVIVLKNRKEQFVPAEYTLLLRWAPILEKEQKGTVLTYLVMQTKVNRVEGDEREGKTWVSKIKLAEIMASSQTTVWRCITALLKYGFLTKESRDGETNLYTILDLPEFKGEECCAEPETKVCKRAVAADTENIFGEGIGDYVAKIKSTKQSEIEMLERLLEGNANDLGRYYQASFFKFFDARCKEKFTLKDRAWFKRLIEEYGWKPCLKAVKYFMSKWDNLGFKDNFPSVYILYTFRERIFAESEGGIGGRTRGQHVASNEGKGVVQW